MHKSEVACEDLDVLLAVKLRSKSLVLHYFSAAKGHQQKTTEAQCWKELKRRASWIQWDFKLIDSGIPNHECLSPSRKQECTLLFYKQIALADQWVHLILLT